MTQEIAQELTRHVWLDVEIKLHQAGVKNRIGSVVSDLVSSLQGQTLAYDEGFPRAILIAGLYHNDAIFAAALWRNLFIAKSDLSAQELAQVLEYIRRNLQHLERMDTQTILEV